MIKNSYINEKLNFYQKSFLTCMLLIVIVIVYFFSKNYLDKPKNSYVHTKMMTFLTNSNELNISKNLIWTKKTISGNLMSLKLAKVYVINNQLEKALKILEKSKNNSVDLNFFNLISFKIAQIYFQKNNIKKAITTIKDILGDSWDSIRNNFIGDVYFKLDNQKRAVTLWKRSIIQNKKIEFEKIIQMKINNYN
ncbi:hypothetical protein bbp_550 [Buchnera aphidicola str. Bp (Baizongia pistaciae)]|uniref:Ancillary SecYEG translocon subunit n=1 Tax=Buchnera aphidicola subsp. Baizongia pistaciae (strain Bp) TaxID=224915 RepID=YFGM_BUCBP|nr:tetratricopeptide repeat protein [Buchnera aphidicola]Q89A13.1 RecName: Full=Ancillary SecYEG translocon subunit; AltName: Full=Chaperone YfgM [Buchnera aphidicola str. Bp (Baizongia pistaciae)]AAO27248.1 hypothetical protein bbp_550 [Buchnera aphidicola str. Bp (Baizongia pistaciae)]